MSSALYSLLLTAGNGTAPGTNHKQKLINDFKKSIPNLNTNQRLKVSVRLALYGGVYDRNKIKNTDHNASYKFLKIEQEFVAVTIQIKRQDNF